MTILDEAIKAQKESKFTFWYKSLSDDERNLFDKEMIRAITNINKTLGELAGCFREVIPNALSQAMLDFTKVVKR